MRAVSKSPRLMLLLAMLAGPAAGSVAAQPQDASENGVMTTVYGSPAPEAAEMTEGPEIEGIISARSDDRLQVTAADGTHTIIAVDETTRIKASGGFLGLSRSKLGAESLLNGLPVSVETLPWDGGLVASEIDLKNKDLRSEERRVGKGWVMTFRIWGAHDHSKKQTYN